MDYRKIAYEARGLDVDFNTPRCERCGMKKACDVDHIEGRGGKHNTDDRMYDPTNLILLCRVCHTKKGGRDWKQKAKQIVLSKIKKKVGTS